jgi:type II secretory ATPase GspE/PulE/Tfp pilus assembly ATPase PilB-like protein
LKDEEYVCEQLGQNKSGGPRQEHCVMVSQRRRELFSFVKNGPGNTKIGDTDLEEHPFIDLRELELDREVGQLLREDISQKIVGICIGQPDDKLLTVVVTEPEETYIYDLVEMSTENRCKAKLLRGDPETVQLALEYIYRVPMARQMEPWKIWLESKKFSSQDLGLVSKDSDGDKVEVTGTAVDAADLLIKEAISSGASDIHLEMFEDGLIVRYRQDGVLRIVNQYTDMTVARAIIKRLKVMGEMNITQDRICQGGRISVKVGNLGYDLRISIVPVGPGESVVMRLLNKGAFSTKLSDLGMGGVEMERYKHMIDAPFGLILTCGPTGSGKSTTLYASLKSIARPDRKILTVEDPVEYQMPGIIQVQVNKAPKDPASQVTFSRALREFLRQDPDVILVGEIRDEETAKIAVQAALTGHLVLSTIHTNDAVGVVNRLKDMGVPPYLIASVLLGSVAQRLVRRLCTDCRQQASPTDEERAIFDTNGVTIESLYRPIGCERCRDTGYRGRVGLYEVFTSSEKSREQIEQDATAHALTATVKSQGMRPLLHDGLGKVAAGMTSLAEVKRVCRDDIIKEDD